MGGPEPAGGTSDAQRLQEIEDQNRQIIDLLEDIRDQLGGGRGRR